MSPKAEGGLWNSQGRSPREFHKPPEGEGHLITTFQNIMVLVCNPRADGAGTNSPRLFTPGETKALAKSKVHQISRAWVTVRGWSSSLISKIWWTVMNSEHCDWSNLKFAL